MRQSMRQFGASPGSGAGVRPSILSGAQRGIPAHLKRARLAAAPLSHVAVASHRFTKPAQYRKPGTCAFSNSSRHLAISWRSSSSPSRSFS